VSNAQVTPIELDLDRTRELRIRWSDGVDSVIGLQALREACPCAECRAIREQREQNPLRVVAAVDRPSDLFTVRDAELVGNYALRIVWADGHATGMYDYPLLRSLGSSKSGGSE